MLAKFIKLHFYQTGVKLSYIQKFYGPLCQINNLNMDQYKEHGYKMTWNFYQWFINEEEIIQYGGSSGSTLDIYTEQKCKRNM